MITFKETNIGGTSVPGLPQIPLVTNLTTLQDFLDKIFTLNVGDVFQFDERTIRYETVQLRLIDWRPLTFSAFDAVYVEPGTTLFSIYGFNTLVVYRKTLI